MALSAGFSDVDFSLLEVDMMRAFYVTCLLALGLTAQGTGCESKKPPAPAPPQASVGEIDAALDSIDQWLSTAQPKRAEVIARSMVADAPDIPEGHVALGRVLLVTAGAARAKGDAETTRTLAEEALLHFTRGIELGSSEPEVTRSAGIAAEQAGRLEDAMKWYRAAADTDQVSNLYLGLALLRNEQPEEARGILEPLAQIRKEDPFLLAALAECQSEMNEHDTAVESIELAIRFAPDEPAFRIRRSALLRRNGRPQAAAESILALANDIRVQEAATEELALALVAMDRPELAAKAWAARSQAFPEDPDAIARTTRAYLDAGELDEARNWLDILLVDHPDHPMAEQLRSDFSKTQRK